MFIFVLYWNVRLLPWLVLFGFVVQCIILTIVVAFEINIYLSGVPPEMRVVEERCVGNTGRHCTTDVNECEVSEPCENSGTCINLLGRGFYCICVNGWTGYDCGVNVDDCADQPCYNGATCHDRVASFYCECPRGKTGNYRLVLCLGQGSRIYVAYLYSV